MLTVYFALVGFAPFTLLLACAAWSAIGRLQRDLRPLPIGASLAQLAMLAAIDTGFAALLLRSAALGGHAPAL